MALRLLALLLLPLLLIAQEDEPLTIEMALYFAPAPSADPLPVLRTLAGQDATAFAVVEELAGAALTPPMVHPHWVALAEYAPPDERAWRYRTRGLEAALRPTVAAAERVLVLEFLVDRREALAANARICRLLAALADATGGLPWDEESRQLYSAAAWRAARVDSWHDGLPDLREHIVMDAYRDGDLIRVVTLGMRKFALPDLVVHGVTSHALRTINHTVNGCAQRLAEGGRIVDGGLDLVLAQVRHPAVRTALQENPGPGATGDVVVRLAPAERQEGDAGNALLDLDFAVEGGTAQERQQAAMKRLFGASDSIVRAKADDAALLAASAQARQRLFAMRAHFAEAFAPGEHLVVKGPFRAEDGRVEWMWVEVTTWKDGVFAGVLVNEPSFVQGLRPGSAVTVPEGDIFDYIWVKPDGTREGNETARLLGGD